MIYFDNAATTPICAVARESVLVSMESDNIGNPSSPHALGLTAERNIKSAAQNLASILGCQASEVVFTSGGTESNNLGILGATRGRREIQILATNQEHPSVIQPLQHLGYDVNFTAPSEWEARICGEKTIACITQVASETGDIFDVPYYAAMIKSKNPEAIIFVDGAQGFCKIGQSLKDVDIYAFSGHKIHGLKGVGGLMVRKKILPLFFGGGQQKGIRPGTENTIGIMAMAAAARFQWQNRETYYNSVSEIKKILSSLVEEIPEVYINQMEKYASPFILNMSFIGVNGETLTSMLSSKGIYISMGTACNATKKNAPLAMLGLDSERAISAVRFSFSGMNTVEEAIQVKETVRQCVELLRKQRRWEPLSERKTSKGLRSQGSKERRIKKNGKRGKNNRNIKSEESPIN